MVLVYVPDTKNHDISVVVLKMEAVGVEPTSENISTRLSPSADDTFKFASAIAYRQAITSAIFDYSTSGRRTPDAVPCFK